MKHSHTRPAEFCRIFTLSLAAAAAVFALGWLLISRPSATSIRGAAGRSRTAEPAGTWPTVLRGTLRPDATCPLVAR